MKYIECYYDQTKPGAPWDIAIEIALAGYSPDERRKVQLVVLPECLRKKSTGRRAQMHLAGLGRPPFNKLKVTNEKR